MSHLREYWYQISRPGAHGEIIFERKPVSASSREEAREMVAAMPYITKACDGTEYLRGELIENL
jgi:hypothetical protein